MNDKRLTHTDQDGRANMVDVSEKPETERTAVASARVRMSAELLGLIRENGLKKGDVLATARIAGIQAAKRTDELIPLCHSLPLTQVSVEFRLADNPPAVEITARATTVYRTGVEMEALTAAAVAALTVYDMGKAVDRSMVIEHVRLEQKSGGKSGDWRREQE